MHCPVSNPSNEVSGRRQLSFTEREMRIDERTSLGIPKLHLLVVGGGEESRSVVVERDVLDCLRVTHERSKTVSLVVDVPKLRKREDK